MPLILHRREFGHDQFSVYDGEWYIGRIYKTTRGDWFWGLDHSAAGNRLINGHAPNSAQAVARLKDAWEAITELQESAPRRAGAK
jgi:hypothetical protein